MTDIIEAKGEPEDAYTLLSTPTLELTDAQVERIVADLRQRRRNFIDKGVKDQPRKAATAAKKVSADDKAANTLALLAQIKIPGLEPKS